jgi:hypothetical protein
VVDAILFGLRSGYGKVITAVVSVHGISKGDNVLRENCDSFKV